MSRSLKKGPFVDAKLAKKSGSAESWRPHRDKDLGPQQHDHARDGGVHLCGAQRSGTCAGADYRKHGWP